MSSGLSAGRSRANGAAPAGTVPAAGAPATEDAAAGPSSIDRSAVSYSATVAKAGNPADAARARVAASPATIETRLSCVVASRDRRRKLIREVATRDPYGSTSA